MNKPIPADEKLILTPAEIAADEAYTNSATPGLTYALPGRKPETVLNTDIVDEKDITQPEGRKGINWNKQVRNLIGVAPILTQLASNTKDPYLHRNPNARYTDAIMLANEMPEEIDISANLAANNRSMLVASKAIDNNDTPSVRAEKAQLLAEKFAGDNSVYQNREVTSKQLRSTKLQTLLGLTERQGADWQADDNRYTTEMRMDKAARENNLFEGLTNLSENMQLAQNDDETIKALNKLTKSVDLDPLSKDLIQNDPEFGKYIISVMRSGKGNFITARNQYLYRTGQQNKLTAHERTITNPKGGQTKIQGTKSEVTT
jgi:hypothetical protein